MTEEITAVKNKKSDAVMLVGVLIVFGLVLGGFGLFRYNIGKISADWPRVIGKITYSRPESRRVDDRTQYSPAVKYTYKVAGRQYVGSRISASDMYQKSLSGARDVLRQYPAGGEVSVFYNPDDPGVSVLETGLPKNVFVLLFAAAACLGFAILITISAVRQKN